MEKVLNIHAHEQDDDAKSSGDILEARRVCLTLGDMQFIFEMVIHDYTYYSEKCKALSNIVQRFASVSLCRFMGDVKAGLFTEKNGKLANGGGNEVKKCETYFVFIEIEIKPPFKAGSNVCVGKYFLDRHSCSKCSSICC